MTTIFHLLKNEVTATEKPLLLRNAEAAFELLEKMFAYLTQSGYEFEFLSGLCDALDASALPEIPLERVTGPGVPSRAGMRA